MAKPSSGTVLNRAMCNIVQETQKKTAELTRSQSSASLPAHQQHSHRRRDRTRGRRWPTRRREAPRSTAMRAPMRDESCGEPLRKRMPTVFVPKMPTVFVAKLLTVFRRSHRRYRSRTTLLVSTLRGESTRKTSRSSGRIALALSSTRQPILICFDMFRTKVKLRVCLGM